MQRTKTNRQSQGILIKEVMAQFDLQTQINKIAVKCFSQLLQSNKQAFEYITQNEKRMGDIQMRTTKMQGFAASIETNLNSKVELMNSFNKRLQTFNTDFYVAMKEDENLIQTMRKDYDTLLAGSQKNTHELRNLKQDLNKANSLIAKMENHLEEELSQFTQRLGNNTSSLQNQIIDVRSGMQKLSTAITQAKAELSAKGTNYDTTSKDMELYKHERLITDRRLKDLADELTIKANKAQVNEMRLFFDSQLTTQKEFMRERIADLRQLIKDEVDDRLKAEKKVLEQTVRKWAIQDKFNKNTTKSIQQLKIQLQKKIKVQQEKLGALQLDLRANISAILKKEKEDILNLSQKIELLNDKREEMLKAQTKMENFQKLRHQEIIELSSSFNALNDTLNTVIRENESRQEELRKLESQTAQNNQGGSQISGALQSIKIQVIEQKKIIAQLKNNVQSLTKRQSRQVTDLKEQQKQLESVLSQQKQQNIKKITEVNRRINNVSIEIMNSLQKSQIQAKSYTDLLRSDLEQRMNMIDQLKKIIQALQNSFAQQMKETQKLNKALSEKMEKINSIITKFKSDLTIRIQNVTNQLMRRTLQNKETLKTLEDLRRYTSYMNQGLSIALAVLIARQTAQEQSPEAVKVSSLLQGWVLEIEEKVCKYRSETLQRRKLLWTCLNFLSHQGDRFKGTVIQSGKDVYMKMQDEQQIFTARKRGISKKTASQLPKLHY